jgi:hypothetical protein
VRALRAPLSAAPEILAPSFDHALKDPAPGAVRVMPRHRVVVVEGLYAFLGAAPWGEAGALLDERWWVAVGVEEARERLVKRHVASGVARDMDEAHWRARENDMPSTWWTGLPRPRSGGFLCVARADATRALCRWAVYRREQPGADADNCERGRPGAGVRHAGGRSQ